MYCQIAVDQTPNIAIETVAISGISFVTVRRFSKELMIVDVLLNVESKKVV